MHYHIYLAGLKPNSVIPDVGCGEGRNAIFLAEHGHTVDAFDISGAAIEKSKYIAAQQGVYVNFFICDLSKFAFSKYYDIDGNTGQCAVYKESV